MAIDAGIVSAYGFAVAHGYTGTPEQFGEDQANFAANAQQVREDKKTVEELVESIPPDYTTTVEKVDTVTDVIGNLFSDSEAMGGATGITRASASEYVGTASAFQTFLLNNYTLDENADAYTIAFDIYTEANSSSSGTGLEVQYGSRSSMSELTSFDNDQTDPYHFESFFSVTYAPTVTDRTLGLKFKANSAPNNIWHVSNIRLFEGSEIPDAVTAKDIDAREKVDEAVKDLEDLKSSFSIDDSIIKSLYFKPEITSGIGFVTENGTIFLNNSTRYKKTDRIACSSGDTFTYMGVGSYSAVSWIFYTGESIVSHGQYANNNVPTTVTIPQGVDGVMFASYRETTDASSVVLEVTFVSEFSEEDKAELRENIGAVSIGEINGVFVKKHERTSANLFDKTNIITGEYISGSGVISAAGYAHTGAIYLEAGTYITKSAYGTYGGNAKAILVVNDSGEYIGNNDGTFAGVNNEYLIIEIDTPKKITYNIRNSQTTLDELMLVAGDSISDYPETYIPFVSELAVESNVHLSEAMVEDVRNLSIGNPLNGKMISADGDSICYGNGYLGGYAKIISEDNNMQYQNIAVGGGTIVAGTYSSGDVPRHWICRSMQALSTSADYILIDGGVNDSSLTVPLGEITNGYTATLDDTTFYGALESIFKTLTTKFVGKKYGFIIPHRMSSGMYGEGLYYKAINDCANKWGVSVLDLTKSVPPFNSFRTTTEYDIIRNEYTTNGDGWHPTEKCYREYYVPQIIAWMKML